MSESTEESGFAASVALDTIINWLRIERCVGISDSGGFDGFGGKQANPSAEPHPPAHCRLGNRRTTPPTVRAAAKLVTRPTVFLAPSGFSRPALCQNIAAVFRVKPPRAVDFERSSWENNSPWARHSPCTAVVIASKASAHVDDRPDMAGITDRWVGYLRNREKQDKFEAHSFSCPLCALEIKNIELWRDHVQDNDNHREKWSTEKAVEDAFRSYVEE
ncbi:hypothetical protein NM208_g10382 [Fusarium decemcellulare]|uniref:Uncharacterized protein n=1 Tax=Fusarium decemcellulare TaxID=57161 RepID=A0ACC1RY32_9HYPO|nr:hypothetical protein NM208_g10382 [Fusarium decemcellulare]